MFLLIPYSPPLPPPAPLPLPPPLSLSLSRSQSLFSVSLYSLVLIIIRPVYYIDCVLRCVSVFSIFIAFFRFRKSLSIINSHLVSVFFTHYDSLLSLSIVVSSTFFSFFFLLLGYSFYTLLLLYSIALFFFFVSFIFNVYECVFLSDLFRFVSHFFCVCVCLSVCVRVCLFFWQSFFVVCFVMIFLYRLCFLSIELRR